MKKYLFRRSLSTLMALTLAMAFMVAGMTEVNAAGSKTYYLPTIKQTYKQVNGKWKKTDEYKYAYDSKGNLTKWAGSKLQIKYSGGKIETVKISGKNKTYTDYFFTNKVYNKKGNIKSIHFEGLKKDGSGILRGYTYSYNKKGYISKRKNVYDESAVKYSYKYHQNGIPSQITESYSYNGVKYKNVEKYNKEGILTSQKKYENGKKVSTLTTKITKKKGKITTIVSSGKDKDGKFKVKHVFKYGKTKTKTHKKHVSTIGMMIGANIAQTIGDNPIVGYCYWN